MARRLKQKFTFDREQVENIFSIINFAYWRAQAGMMEFSELAESAEPGSAEEAVAQKKAQEYKAALEGIKEQHKEIDRLLHPIF